MNRTIRGWELAAVVALSALAPGAAAASDPLPTISETVENLQKREGLLDLYIDEGRGKVWLRLPPPSGPGGEVGRYLYFEGLVTGVGSNPIGLDRAQLGDTRVVSLRRSGGRVLVEQLNLRFRALSEHEAERRAVDESFATSVVWAADVAARDPDGSVLVDFTSFLIRDVHHVVRTLKTTDQGSFSLDADRSAVDLDACLAFPDNVELEALLTFAGSEPGEQVRATTPAPQSITVVVHQSMLRLPDDDYRPRRFDPRIGCYAVEFADYAAPLDAPIEKRWIVRHRLEKTDPRAERSRVKKPIVYYVDPATPEPVRSALIEGASWWAEAFDECGFIDAFRVELLPEGAHPLDARYNVINWVHRATRGWSYGWGVSDPRTGEMLKGHVLLGSLRLRQDRRLFEGLAGTAQTGSGRPDDPIELSLARIRQLAAHEVGHALGITHNFAASAYGRASVMDYPAPLVRLTEEGDLDFSDAYAVGLGEWDKWMIRYAYSEFAPGTDESEALNAIVADGVARGLVFLTDADARPAGAAQPIANLWDNGENAEDELARLMDVRRAALARFGAHNVAPGQPLALLEEVLAPVYFLHRYQIDAAAKVVGGLDYRYWVRGDDDAVVRALDGARQRRAISRLLDTVEPEALDLSDEVLALLAPRPFGHERTREQLGGHMRPAFDAPGAAATAADLVAGALLQPERCARLVDQNRRNADLPGLEEMLSAIRERLFGRRESPPPRLAQIRREVQGVFVETMIELAADSAAAPSVRARVEWELGRLREELRRGRARDDAERAHRALLVSELTRHLERRGPGGAQRAPEPPPGSPIGSPAPEILSGCSWGEPPR